eukprot:Anaeramoba_ignava/a478895_47.p1 GENE.a478895_47~~a478895_47.p1  ORF type:complete len:873 (+),score=290.05 a478895_47:16-2634(+)
MHHNTRRVLNSGDELLKLQEILKREKYCLEAEQNALETIRQQSEKLLEDLQSGVVELINMSRLMETLSVGNIEYKLKREEKITQNWKVQIYDPFESPLSSVQKGKYQKMMQMIRENLDVLALSMSDTRNLNRTCTETLSHSAIFAVFGHLFSFNEEMNLLKLLKKLIELQIQQNPNVKELLTGNKLLARLLSAYSKTGRSNAYLISSLRSPMLDVIQDLNLDLLSATTNKQIDKDGVMTRRLIFYAKEFLGSLHDKIKLIPYGIRWICKFISEICKQNKLEKDMVHVVGDFFFLKYVNPVILSPERYGVVSDVPILKKSRFNLTQIAKILLSLCHGTSSLRTSDAMFGNKIDEFDINMKSFINDLINVPEKIVSDTTQDNFILESFPNAKNSLVTPNDLYALHSLLYEFATMVLPEKQNVNEILQNPLIQFMISFGKPPDFITETEMKYLPISLGTKPKTTEKKKVVQESKSFSQRRKTFGISELGGETKFSRRKTTNLHSFQAAFPSQNDDIMNEAERKLRQVLCKIDYFVGKKGKSFIDILLEEKEAAHASHSIDLACLLDSTIQTLEKMPLSVKKAEYRPLIWKIKKEHETRQNYLKDLIEKKYNFQHTMNQLQVEIDQIQSQIMTFDQYMNCLATNLLIEKNQDKINKVIQDLKSAFDINDLEKKISEFYTSLQQIISSDSLCSYLRSMNPLLKIAENYAYIDIYSVMFQPRFMRQEMEKEDTTFSIKNVTIKHKMTPDFLGVPEDFWDQSMWFLAIKELSSVNTVKSPLLKIECLAHCAQVVNNILLFNGISEIGADLMLPIIIYVIAISNPPNLPSNIKFIDMFCDRDVIDPEYEYWFTVFKSAYLYLSELDLQTLPKKKVLYKDI